MVVRGPSGARRAALFFGPVRFPFAALSCRLSALSVRCRHTTVDSRVIGHLVLTKIAAINSKVIAYRTYIFTSVELSLGHYVAIYDQPSGRPEAPGAARRRAPWGRPARVRRRQIFRPSGCASEHAAMDCNTYEKTVWLSYLSSLFLLIQYGPLAAKSSSQNPPRLKFSAGRGM